MNQHQLHMYRFFRGAGTMILVLLFVCFATFTAQANQGQQDKKKTAPPAKPQQAAPAPKPQQAAPAPKPQQAAPAPRPQQAAPAPKPQQAAPAPKPQQVQQQQQQRGQQQQQVQQQQQQKAQQQQQVQQQQQQKAQQQQQNQNKQQQVQQQQQQKAQQQQQVQQQQQQRGQQQQQNQNVQQQRGQQQQQVQQQQQQKAQQQQQQRGQQQQQNQNVQQQRGQQQRGQQQQLTKRAPQVIRTQNGGEIHKNAGGQVTQVRTPAGAVIRHAPTGERRVEVAKPGNRVVVSTARGHGYVQKPFVVANHSYVQRTYMVNGRSSVRVYRPMNYHGLVLNAYTPMRYYRPAFYTYAYTPWARPISYSWGWAGNPWFAYYGGYFTPYPFYTSPSLWLTDYLIASTLQAAYQERVDAGLAAQAIQNESPSQGVLTPEVKQMVADEVRRQLDLERAEQATMGSGAADNVPSMFSDNAEHVFVVSRSLVVPAGDQECTLGAGDVIRMRGLPPTDSTSADMMVLASNAQSCPRGWVVSVQLNDLQEMQNDMRATIDQGLENLQQHSGQGGLPVLPAASVGTVNASFASQAKADADVNNQLNQVTQDADHAEQEVINQSDNTPPGGVAPKTISLGQTIAEVVDILGQPVTIVNLGSKVIYTYKDLKITFVDGRVTDVQ